MPAAIMTTNSMDLRAKLSSSGRFLTAIPQSVLRYGDDRGALQKLPVDVFVAAMAGRDPHSEESQLEPRRGPFRAQGRQGQSENEKALNSSDD
jgi:hypothetical protein